MVFIVVIIGGLGSVGGCFIGALLMALLHNYAGFLAPKLALVSNIVLMIAILLWRPAGLYSKGQRAEHARPDSFPATCRAAARCRPCCSLILLGLLLAPFLFSGARPLNTAATICVYIVLVASYDLLLGYTGIVSFAHTMFYGIGAYGVGIALASVDEPTWSVDRCVGLALALLLTVVLAFVIGLFALRVRAIFYAMITLAVASSFAVLASQLSDFTGGEDGRTFSVPELLSPGFTPDRERRVRTRRRRQADHLLPRVLRLPAAVPVPAAPGEFALRPRAAGDPRKRVPRRGARLPHRRLPHLGQRAGAPSWPRWPAR